SSRVEFRGAGHRIGIHHKKFIQQILIILQIFHGNLGHRLQFRLRRRSRFFRRPFRRGLLPLLPLIFLLIGFTAVFFPFPLHYSSLILLARGLNRGVVFYHSLLWLLTLGERKIRQRAVGGCLNLLEQGSLGFFVNRPRQIQSYGLLPRLQAGGR